MKLTSDPDRPGDLYLDGVLFASIHPGQSRDADRPAAELRALAEEVARRWNNERNVVAPAVFRRRAAPSRPPSEPSAPRVER